MKALQGHLSARPTEVAQTNHRIHGKQKDRLQSSQGVLLCISPNNINNGKIECYIVSVCAVVNMRFSSDSNIKCARDTPPLILITFL
jgi:hypothetical protein